MHRRIFLISAVLIGLLLCLSVFAAADGELARVTSPDGSVAVALLRAQDGRLLYTVTKDGKAVLESGSVGLAAAGGSFPGTRALQSVTQTVVDETKPTTSGSYRQIDDCANEITLTFDDGYAVIFRAYDDGAAFRQTLSGSGSVKITRDASVIALPATAAVWAMETDNTSNAYSTAYTHTTVDKLGGMYYFPMLYQTAEGVWGLLCEADLYGSGFAGCVLQAAGEGSFALVYAAYQNGEAVSLAAPLSTPWRAVVCGDLSAMVENTMTDALTPAADGDFSYVQTGVCAWSWLNDGSPRQDDPALVKRYIDLAAEMKWEYVALDEGWQPYAADYTPDVRTYTGFPDWLPDLVAYASARNVKLIAWLNRRAADTDAEVGFLEELRDAGFAGVKVDFFDSESAGIVAIYNRILKKCAELGLVVNIHGTNKPTGERMTYPNIISKEAVHGDESRKTAAAYTTLLPFTRGSLGSTDFTPAAVPFSGSDTTVGHQAALAVLLECGMPTMASAPGVYYASPFYWYYYDLPSRWDDLRLIEGDPGSYVTLARRSGDLWYVAGVTTAARTLRVSTDFLAGGEYIAAIYGDGGVSYRRFTAGDILTADLPKNGGAVLKIAPADAAPQSLSFVNAFLPLAVGETATVGLAAGDAAFPDVWWSSSDESVVEVKNGHLFGVSGGRATITVTSAANPAVTATLSVHVYGGSRIAENWTVKHQPEDFVLRGVTDNLNPYKLTLYTNEGLIGKNETSEPKNMWMTDAPGGDFEMTVKVSGEMTHSYNSCLIGVYADGANVIQMSRRFHSTLGSKVDAPPSKMGRVGNIFDFYMYTTKYVEHYAADTNGRVPAWMRLTRTGDVFRGYYSYDGVNFTEMPGTLTNANISGAASLKIVLACQSGAATFTNEVLFEDLTVNGEKIPFTAPCDDQPGGADILDALTSLRASLDGGYISAADLDRDGKLSLTDVLKLLKLLVN